jgi:hypothetical protein
LAPAGRLSSGRKFTVSGNILISDKARAAVHRTAKAFQLWLTLQLGALRGIAVVASDTDASDVGPSVNVCRLLHDEIAFNVSNDAVAHFAFS